MSRSLKVASSLLLGIVLACDGLTAPRSTALAVNLSVESSTLHVVDSTSLVLVVRNVSNRAVTYDVGAGNGAFDFAIERPNGTEVWRLSHQPRTLPAETLTIPRGGSATFPITLRVGGPAGAVLSPGAYKIRGLFVNSRGDVIATANPVLDLSVTATRAAPAATSP